MLIKLIDLHPRWVGAGGEGVYNADGTPAAERHGVGISFDCPCEKCSAKRNGDEEHDRYLRVFVAFSNPLDRGPAHDPRPNQQWSRIGETFETLQLSPSIQRHRIGEDGCEWHGFVGINGAGPGEVITI